MILIRRATFSNKVLKSEMKLGIATILTMIFLLYKSSEKLMVEGLHGKEQNLCGYMEKITVNSRLKQVKILVVVKASALELVST